MIVGFTGSREGMNRLQLAMFVGVLARLCPDEFHHGGCVGSDAMAHALVREHAPRCRIVIHPPISPEYAALCSGDEMRPAAPYLVRNRAIVIAVDEMVAAPRSRVEELRSGTWSTVRTARRVGKPVHMVWP